MKGGIAILKIKQFLRHRFCAFSIIVLLIFAYASPAMAALPEVYVGGQSIGIMLKTDGVTVVGFSPIITADGTRDSPAESAGLQVGDFIVSVNDEQVYSNQQIASLINKIGENEELCCINYLRAGTASQIELKPQMCTESGQYRIGLYVRDSTAGIGTLTFWEPESGVYGALGHSVSELEYGVENAEIGMVIRASVSGIKLGEKGSPGEKLGLFSNDEWSGSIVSNCEYGVYGYFDTLPVVGGEIMQTAAFTEIETGPASIYTVLNGEEVETFEVNITKISHDYSATGECLIVEVTDERLLKLSGGIVQGMSGSPIVQNGKLIGAVTHVFVNEPARGYGIPIEKMLTAAEQASLIANNGQ